MDDLHTIAGIEAASWIASRTDGSGAKFLNAGSRAFWEKAAADPVLAEMMSALILRVGHEHGYWPNDREIVTTPARLRPGVTDVMALRVGYEKLNLETGWEPKVSRAEGLKITYEYFKSLPREV